MYSPAFQGNEDLRSRVLYRRLIIGLPSDAVAFEPLITLSLDFLHNSERLIVPVFVGKFVIAVVRIGSFVGRGNETWISGDAGPCGLFQEQHSIKGGGLVSVIFRTVANLDAVESKFGEGKTLKSNPKQRFG